MEKRKLCSLTFITPMFFSLIAIFISFISLYNEYFNPADIRIIPAERIGFSYHQDNQTLWVTIPMIFRNNGSKTGNVYSMGLCMYDPQKGNSQVLFLKWNHFGAFNNEQIFYSEDRATPIFY